MSIRGNKVLYRIRGIEVSSKEWKAAFVAALRKKRNKYGAKKCEADGHKFDSLEERERYYVLKLREKVGEIRDLEVHVRINLLGPDGKHLLYRSERYPNGRKVVYEVDFRYNDLKLCRWVREDVKGHRTELYKLKRAIMESMGLPVTEISVRRRARRAA